MKVFFFCASPKIDLIKAWKVWKRKLSFSVLIGACWCHNVLDSIYSEWVISYTVFSQGPEGKHAWFIYICAYTFSVVVTATWAQIGECHLLFCSRILAFWLILSVMCQNITCTDLVHELWHWQSTEVLSTASRLSKNKTKFFECIIKNFIFAGISCFKKTKRC